jgi:hypothetical protein
MLYNFLEALPWALDLIIFAKLMKKRPLGAYNLPKLQFRATFNPKHYPKISNVHNERRLPK